MAQQIHPTAIIESGAELASDVVIGAYAYVGNKAIIGAGTILHHHGNVEGRTTIGRERLSISASSILEAFAIRSRSAARRWLACKASSRRSRCF